LRKAEQDLSSLAIRLNMLMLIYLYITSITSLTFLIILSFIVKVRVNTMQACNINPEVSLGDFFGVFLMLECSIYHTPVSHK